MPSDKLRLKPSCTLDGADSKLTKDRMTSGPTPLGRLSVHRPLVAWCILFVLGYWANALALRTSADEQVFLQHMMNLQRFQALCRLTNDAPPIRVLIYGQSITVLPWTMRVVDSVRAEHPGRQWIVQNRCIPGAPSQDLLHTSEADVFPFNPDLVIFQGYGDQNAYRSLVASIRARTTSDILLINNHYVYWDSVTNSDIGDWDGRILPEIALSNGACMADIRTPWREYLLQSGLPYSALLSDGVHPNEAGQFLMQDLVSRYVSGPSLAPTPDPYDCGRARRLIIPDASASSGEWRIRFDGTRVAGRVRNGTARVIIDGISPSQRIGGGVHGRASPWPDGWWWPCLLRIRTEAPLGPEHWKLRIDATNGPKSFQFSLTGSVTGADGNGSTSTEFHSNSGRVVILPEDWWWDLLFGSLTPGTVLTWDSTSTGTDTVTGRTNASGSNWVDLVSNLSPGTHELVIQQKPGAPALDELVVYNPAGGGLGSPGTLYQLPGTNGFAMLVRKDLQSSSDFRNWRDVPAPNPAQANTNYLQITDTSRLFYRVKPVFPMRP